MEINDLIKNRIISDLHFVGLTLAIWVITIAGLNEPGETISLTQLSLISVTAIASLLMLKALEYDKALQVISGHSEVVTRTLAFLFGAIFGYVVSYLMFARPLFHFSDKFLIASLILAIAVFAAYALTTFIILGLDHKKRIFLDLSPRERQQFIQGVEARGLSKYFEYLTRETLGDKVGQGILSKVDLIVISRGIVKQFGPDTPLLRAHLAGVPIIDIGDIICKISGRVHLSDMDLATYLLGATKKTLLRRSLFRAKYMLEPLVAFFMAIALLPAFVIVALLIKRYSPGPIFYRQLRTGHLGKQFYLLKFRSMRVDAENDGPQWAAPQDTRITSIGKFMRRSRLDELPQLWNVMRGEMSFIGPRPERPEIYEKLKVEIPLFSLRTLVRPGITGWAQVSSGYAASSAESLLKLEYDLYYIQHMSLRFDLGILFKTFAIVFVGDRNNLKSETFTPVPEVPAGL